MLVPGIASVTFRDKTAQEIVELAARGGLQGIEWGGDIHVPTGQLKLAATLGRLTRATGLTVSGYGSYYIVGKSREEGMPFMEVLKTAEALNAPMVRIWAGAQASRESTQAYRRKIIDETREIADAAGRKGIRLAFEFHDDTLNDTYTACRELLAELAHPQVKTYWQPRHGVGPEVNGLGIDLILPWIAGIHVFHWWPKAEVRLPLVEGANDWKCYLDRLSKISETIPANLEFVKDDSTEQFLEDTSTFLSLVGAQQASKKTTS